MKFFHLSDLHLGRQLYQYSLIEEQRNILEQIVKKAQELHPDAILISGDIYDRTIPSTQAIGLANDFFSQLTQIKPSIPVLVIAGNHDSPWRLAYACEILAKQNLYLVGLPPSKEDEFISKVTLADEWGKVNFYLLPFVKPSMLRGRFKEEEFASYEQAVRFLLDREDIDDLERNVILSHQFYLAKNQKISLSDSETIMVGGIDQVDVQCLDRFDYAALGHIHRAQKIGREKNRYCGTLLAYSLSEISQEKRLTVVELKGKKEKPVITEEELIPLRKVYQLKGSLEELMLNPFPEGFNADDYVQLILTDKKELYRPKEQLEKKYHRILEVQFDYAYLSTQWNKEKTMIQLETPLEIFADFYQEVHGSSYSLEEEMLIKQIMDSIVEEEE